MTTAVSLAQSAAPGVSLGFKNRIINGGMVVDQRNAGASVTPASGDFVVDRFRFDLSQASKITCQQNAGSVTPPVGFSKYAGITSSSAYSVGSGDYFTVKQVIEGYNIADLAWGTANAKAVTLSFQVYSSLTGTFGVTLRNGSNNRSYPATYTISSANTWTSISITIPGDTTGTWATDNSAGVSVMFGLGVGSTYSGTPGSWAAANYLGATGATSVVGTNGATFYITGVQLEVGTTATSFEFRDYGRELIMCQRYYNNFSYGGTSWFVSSTTSYSNINFPTMRATPSFASTGGYQQYGPGGQLSVTISGYSGSSPTDYGVSLVQSGGGTTNDPGYWRGSFQLSAEL